MIPGETIMIFTNPLDCTIEEGQAKLIERLMIHNKFVDSPDKDDYEYWSVEFLDSPGNYYPRLIKYNRVEIDRFEDQINY